MSESILQLQTDEWIRFHPMLEQVFGKGKNLETKKTPISMVSQDEPQEDANKKDVISVLRNALRRAPRTVEIYYCLIQQLLQKGKGTEAKTWWEIARKIAPRCGKLWLLGLDIALQRNEENIAESCLKNAARFLPKKDRELLRGYARLDLWRGRQAWERGETDRGLFWMRHAIHFDAEWSRPWLEMAEALQDIGRFERANHYFQKAAQLDATAEAKND